MKHGFLLIFAAGLLAHGLVYFTDYPLWDGWNYYHRLTNPAEWPWMVRQWHEGGRPLDLQFFIPLRWVSQPVIWSKWIGVTSWIVTSLIFVQATRCGRIFSDFDSTIIGLLGVTMPFFDVLGDLNALSSTLAVLFFWLAWWMVFVIHDFPDEHEKYLRRVFLRIAALFLFFVSFILNSQLIYYYAFALIVLLSKCNRESLGRILRHPGLYIARSLDFTIIPVIFWCWKSIFTPTYGDAGGYNGVKYNSLQLDVHALLDGFKSLFVNLVYGEISMTVFSKACMMIGIVLAMALYIVQGCRRERELLPAGTPRTTIPLILIGMGLFFAGSFPYVAVGQLFDTYGWKTRNAILLNYPAAMIIWGGIRLLQSWIFPKRPNFVYPVLCWVIIAGIVKCNIATFRLQALAAKDYSIANQVRAGLQGKGANIVNLRDYFIIPGTIYYYPPIVWMAIITPLRQASTALVVDTSISVPDQWTNLPDDGLQRTVPVANLSEFMPQFLGGTNQPYSYPSIPDHGETVTVAVEPGEFGSDGISLGFNYMSTKFFAPSRLESFVNRVAKVTFLTGNRTLILKKEQVMEVVANYQAAVEISPHSEEAPQNTLGSLLLQEGHVDEAIGHFQTAVDITPDFPEAQTNLGLSLSQKGRNGEAMIHLRKALELRPSNTTIQNALAWMLATAPPPSSRNGVEAVQLAMEATQLSGGNDPHILRTLAAAYAEAGRFPQAVNAAQIALQLAQTRQDTGFTDALHREIKLYEAGLPFQ